MFKSTSNKGFHIVLPNGITISSQFGFGNYCSNRHDEDIHFPLTHPVESVESNSCEIAIWTKKGKWITQECPYCDIMENDDMVEGYVGIDKWLLIFDWCKDYYKEKQKQTVVPREFKGETI